MSKTQPDAIDSITLAMGEIRRIRAAWIDDWQLDMLASATDCAKAMSPLIGRPDENLDHVNRLRHLAEIDDLCAHDMTWTSCERSYPDAFVTPFSERLGFQRIQLYDVSHHAEEGCHWSKINVSDEVTGF